MQHQYAVNLPFREYIERTAKADNDVLGDLVKLGSDELFAVNLGVSEIGSAEDLLEYVIGSLTHEEGAFASRDFWKQATYGLATVYIISTLRSVLNSKVNGDLLDRADSATEPSSDESSLLAFFEALTGASASDQQVVGDLLILATNTLALLAVRDKSTRRNMGIKLGIFS